MLKDEEYTGRNERDLARQNITGKNPQSPAANTPVRVLTATSIIGDRVENSKGEKLGEIKNIMLDVRSGCTEYIVLEFGGFLGFGEKLFAVPFKALRVNTDNKSFILDIDKDFLNNAPGFDKDHWPETNSRHWEEINSYWNDYANPLYPGSSTII